MLKSGNFDLVILDINMPDTESFSLASYILQEFPSIRVMIFTMCKELSFAIRFLKLGVHGYLFKDAGEAEVQRAVQVVMSGNIYMGDWLAQAILEERIAPREISPFDRLSDRELEVALQLIKGLPISRIADTLHLNRSTIGSHKSRIIRKLKVTNTIELINLAKVCGLIYNVIIFLQHR
jgi:DNA-binding NarL/FixJ family response regulator